LLARGDFNASEAMGANLRESEKWKDAPLSCSGREEKVEKGGNRSL